jgi:hypothetical protein
MWECVGAGAKMQLPPIGLVRKNTEKLPSNYRSVGSQGISRYVGCLTMPNNRLDPTSVLLVQHHVHLRSILR